MWTDRVGPLGTGKSERNYFSPNLHLTSDKLAFWEMFWGHYDGSRIPRGRSQSDVHPTLHIQIRVKLHQVCRQFDCDFSLSHSSQKKKKLFSCMNNLWGFIKCCISALVRPSVNLCGDFKVTNIRKKKSQSAKDSVDTSPAANFKTGAPKELSPKKFNPSQREWSILMHLPS